MRRVAARVKLAVECRLNEAGELLLEFLQNQRDIVDVDFHFFMIALIRLRDQFVNLAMRHLSQNPIPFANRQQNGV